MVIKPIKMKVDKNMNVKIVRLNSGEEILCDHKVSGQTKTNKNSGTHTLKEALIIIPQAQGQLGFMKWMPYADTENGIELKDNFVAFVVEPDKQLKDDYTSHINGVTIPDIVVPNPAGPIGIVS